MIYSNDEKALIFISQFDFITSSKIQKILEVFENPGDIFHADGSRLFQLKDILKTKYELFINELLQYNEKDFFNNLAKRGVKCLTIFSQNYPQKLLNLKNPPYVLYYCGNIDLLSTKCLAIVGTRSPSNYGKIITEKFAKEIASSGITVISGLATGVDKIAHEGALEVGGNTIAVLGGGFDHMFPAMNVNLAREIAKKGLIITEYYLSIKPTKYSFPTRNRIIAAIADHVLITEANFGSGSLYTKEYADDLGKESFAIPGNITSEKSCATNNLIKAGSVHCVTCVEDILSEFGILKTKKEVTKIPNLQMSVEEATITELLKDGEKDFEYLLEKTNMDIQALNFNLTTLEIRGIIKKLAGNMYILVA